MKPIRFQTPGAPLRPPSQGAPGGAANAILLLSCPDRKGLVAGISNFIHAHDGNVVDAAQHSSEGEGSFFLRIEWALEGFGIPRHELPAALEPMARAYGMSWTLAFTDEVPRIAILASRHLHCLYDLVVRQRMGEFRGHIALVISNHEEVRAVVEPFGIPFEHVPITPETKADQERRQLDLLETHDIDLVVLARYMQVLGRDFVARYPSRIINIHHSFLPAFAEGNPHLQAFQRGVKIIGATSHYVTEILDDGPIIAQEVTPISHRDSVEDIRHKGRDLERITLAKAVKLHLENRILVCGSKTLVFE